MKKVNGELGAAIRLEIYRRDLTIKEAAAVVHRSDRIVYKVLAGKKVSEKTITQFEIAFPQAFA